MKAIENVEYNTEKEFWNTVVQRSGDKVLVEDYKKSIVEYARTEKTPLVIIDDLDKLKDEFARKIFIEEHHLLTMVESKIIFTFPLSTYYSPSFVHIDDKFTDQFIRIVNLADHRGDYLQSSLDVLKRLILKRINREHITDDAMKLLIDKSGGLLRDLIQFMQDACKSAIDEEATVIDTQNGIPQKIVQNKINQYNRLFDFPQYERDARQIMQRRDRADIENEHLVYLLRYLFVLEYGKQGDESWYDVHPCLKECFSQRESR